MNECQFYKEEFYVIFNYKINGYFIEEIYNKYNNKNINIDLNNSLYIDFFAWINSYDQAMFEKILSNIHFYAFISAIFTFNFIFYSNIHFHGCPIK